jgi:sugar phosphate isomerase/epimerase
MMENKNKNSSVSRRNFIKTSAIAAGSLAFLPAAFQSKGIIGMSAQERVNKRPNSEFGGIQIGAITFAFRDLPSTAESMLGAAKDTGISSLELMGDVIESYAGLPPGPTELPEPLSPQAKARVDDMAKKYHISLDQLKNSVPPAMWSMIVSGIVGPTEEQRKWRTSVPMNKFEELRKMYNNAGVNIHIAKLAPSSWSDGEIDYTFKVAKTLGAGGISDEIGEESCKRLAPFAEKYKSYAIFHNHAQLADKSFNLDELLAFSPAIMLNFDCGHYYGTTGKNPCDFIEKYHNRIFSIHLNDNLGPGSAAPDTNKMYGQGQTPLAEVLILLKKHAKDNEWPKHADIDDTMLKMSNSVEEVKSYVEYCRKILS